MQLQAIDWIVIVGYIVFAVGVGMALAKRASSSVDEFFLSGRSLPWWIAGTSMVATSFAADTPLVVTGWVRDFGIWKNWLWWCYCTTSMLGVFIFVRLWRRGGVMTKAELAELRYGGSEASVLRGALGIFHACFTNTIVLCWVMLAASKIAGGLFEIDKTTALALACALSMSYSLLSGFWGVVLTDLLQFVMSVVGAILLAVFAWKACSGIEGVTAVVAANDGLKSTLQLFPSAGDGDWWTSAFWTAPVAAIAVYFGVSWWAAESVDGSGVTVQRVAACKDERHGVLAVLWFTIAHYALRPWPWIVVALASLVLLPTIEVKAPVAGVVLEVEDEASDRLIRLLPADGGEAQVVSLETTESTADWRALPKVEAGERVAEGAILARTDSESAYVVMMTRLLGPGLLGLVVASLFAAFMSTIDTHVNLASSFFVNDVYRRFLDPHGSPRYYVWIARGASLVVLLVAAVFARYADRISELFTFFLAFLGGVGPAYILRWLWWRVRAQTEIVAMCTSALSTVLLTFVIPDVWELGPLSTDGALSSEGRIVIVVACSLLASLTQLFVARPPDPTTLVAFYERVRPVGHWGPVRRLATIEAVTAHSWLPPLLGIPGGLCLVFGLLFGVGNLILSTGGAAIPFGIAALGAVIVGWSLRMARPVVAR